MILLVILSVIAAAIAGYLVKISLDRTKSRKEITWKEYSIGMAVIAVVLSPLITTIGREMAVSSVLNYEEFLNGWETEAVRLDTKCSRDGPCVYEYSCDPYLVTYPCNCDDNGCQTCTRTEWHSCPYVTVESDYVVKTTVGDCVIDNNRFPENPQRNRWRESKDIPQHVINRAGTGAPKRWMEAKRRIDEGRPGPATVKNDYEDYVLASEQTIMKQGGTEKERFLEENLLPDLNSEIEDYYLADRVYFVGYTTNTPMAWYAETNYFNGALGYELQGNLHLVIVQNDMISSNPDAYKLALRAYWQDPEIFEERSLSKNAIVVIIGTDDGSTVSWARSFTGMPLGNERMTTEIRNELTGVELTPKSLLGTVRAKLTGSVVSVLHSNGALESIIWGMENKETKFTRYSMSGDAENDVGEGFKYLRDEIEPTFWQKVTILFFTFLGAAGVWFAMAAIGERSWKRRR